MITTDSSLEKNPLEDFKDMLHCILAFRCYREIWWLITWCVTLYLYSFLCLAKLLKKETCLYNPCVIYIIIYIIIMMVWIGSKI